MTIQELTAIIMQLAKEKGFGMTPGEISIPEKMMLIHAEVSEAYEAYRDKNMNGKDGFNEEMSDILIRLLHLCAVLGIDIEAEALKKLEYNKSRTWEWDKMNEKNPSILPE